MRGDFWGVLLFAFKIDEGIVSLVEEFFRNEIQVSRIGKLCYTEAKLRHTITKAILHIRGISFLIH